MKICVCETAASAAITICCFTLVLFHVEDGGKMVMGMCKSLQCTVVTNAGDRVVLLLCGGLNSHSMSVSYYSAACENLFL